MSSNTPHFSYKDGWVANFAIGIVIHHVLIKERCYSVTIAIINFVRPEFDRVFHKDSANTKFDDFKGLVTVNINL